MSLKWVWLSHLWKTSSGVVGSRGPERPASGELLSRVAPPSGGPFQQAECHAGATAPRSAGSRSLFFRDSSTNLGILKSDGALSDWGVGPLACFDYAVPCNAYIEGPSWFI